MAATEKPDCASALPAFPNAQCCAGELGDAAHALYGHPGGPVSRPLTDLGGGRPEFGCGSVSLDFPL